MTIEDYKEMDFLLFKLYEKLNEENKELQARINKAIEQLKEEQEQLEEWHFDGFDPCLPDIINTLEGEYHE